MDGKTIIERWQNDRLLSVSTSGYAPLVQMIDAAIAQARAEERENCAKTVEDYPHPIPYTALRENTRKRIASAIRARRP